MKQCAVILILTFSLNCYSQEWKLPWGNWTYEYSVSGVVKGLTTNFIGDTTEINGKKCRVMSRGIQSCIFRPEIEYLHKRNDSLFYYESTNNSFELLYDFSADVGDTTKIRNWPMFNFEHEFFYLRIDSIDTIEFNQVPLKRFHVRYGWDGINGIEFGNADFFTRILIEEIGSLSNYFHFPEDGFCDGAHVRELRCYEDETDLLNFNTDLNCDEVIVGTVSNKELYIKVYPNPFLEMILIENLEPKNSNVKIFNVEGKVVVNTPNFVNGIDGSGLQNGIYFLLIENRETRIIKKIIKK